MKKQSLRKLLAMLLCLSMALSLLPAGALATGQGEQLLGVPPTTSSDTSEEVKETGDKEEMEDEDVATDESVDDALTETTEDDTLERDQLSTEVPEDGAVADTWTQSPATVYGDDAVCKKENGKLTLKAGAGNGNNAGAKPGGVSKPLPAMFVDEEMTEALEATEGEKTLSFKMTPSSTSENVCFGVFLNYAEPANADTAVYGMAIIYNTIGGWNAQHYFGTADIYPTISGLPKLEKDTEYTVEVKWTDSAIVSIKVNGAAGTIDNDGANFTDVTDSLGVIDKVGFKLGKDPQTSGISSVVLSDIHYSGQATVTAYDVSGTVTDGASPVADATVTVGTKTATTSSEGTYTVSGFLNGDYAVTVEKEGYWSPEASEVTIDSADVSGKDLTLAPYVYNDVSGTVTTEDGTPLENAAVEAGGKKAATDAEGKYTLAGVLGGQQSLTVSLDGYDDAAQEITVPKTENTPLTGVETKLKPDSTTATLSTADMDVRVDLGFPRVVRYTMKGDNEGKVMFGQTEMLDTVTINGVNIVPVVTSKVAADKSKVTYTMAAVDTNIDCVIHAELVAKDNVLTFNINRIDNNLNELAYPVESISIPNHSLVSVRSDQPGANLAGAQMSTNTTTSGDVFYDNTQFGSANNGYFYAFVSTDTLSAGMASNSEVGTSGAGGDNYRVRSTAENRGEYTSLGLSSALWYYDRTLLSTGSATDNAALSDEQKVMGPTELPLYAKVVITGDENGDNAINWQDGAIAARDTIVHIPFRGDDVRDLVGIRIAMNFASQATNPFLTTLDNVKRVAMSTDGLGQTVLLKGYANEGHDSGHPDFGDIGSRMGGAKDFNTLMTEGRKYGASFGIHINTSEFYPEAEAFSSKMVRRNASGGLDYRWNWLDQGIAINGQYDLASGSRADRLADLKRQVGDNLDFIYVDVWGNTTSGSENAWQTRKLSKQLTDNGWRVAHEWSWANEWESTLQHWTTDFPYGGYGAKGINSMVERFLLNSYKDSWVSDFPSYGGAAMAPLLGGPIMQGFEGWQGDAEYDQTIDNMFNQMLPYKFLQHYNIMSWENADNTVMLKYPEGTKEWTPDKSVTLQSKDGTDKISVTRDGTTFDTAEEQMAYRSRTITLNEKVILRGAPTPGEISGGGAGGYVGTQSYLIPWNWDSNGETFADADKKMYHYNNQDGTTTWDLQTDWAKLANVKVYELTDNGRTGETIVPIVDGTITLTAKANTAYVVIKGESTKPGPVFDLGLGMHLKDASFDSANITDYWTVGGKGSAVRAMTSHQLPMLKLSGEVTVSQTLTDLIPGQQYAVYLGVDNRSDAKASMAIDVDGTIVASNYTLRSLATNWVKSYHYNNNNGMESGGSYYQNMYVFFTAPSGGKVTLTLSRADGAGNTYFDDVRVVENEAQNLTVDADGNMTKFSQDFENVAQGQYPFVVGPVSGLGDDHRQHLSQKHDPFTQAGWDVKKLDDVLSGDWSLKANGLTGRNKILYQTIPQNIHFEPGVTYTVKFDYQMGSAGTYDLVYGSSEYAPDEVTTLPLKKSLGTTATCVFTLVGDPNGQTWFGIRSTSQAPQFPTSGMSEAEQNFGGYKDFVLDNLVVERSAAQKGELAKLIAQANGMAQADYEGDWDTFEAARTAAQAVMNNQKATQAQIDAAVAALDNAMKALTKLVGVISGTITDANGPVAGVTVILQQGTRYLPVGVSAVTDAEGKYTLSDLSIKAYTLKVTAPGYDVQTVAAFTPVASEVTTKDVTLTAQSAAAYVNTFDTGDVTMMKSLERDATKARARAVQHNGSGAVELSGFSSGDARGNMLDMEGPMMKNGTIEMDLTYMGEVGKRLGVSLRGSESGDIWVGSFETGNDYSYQAYGPDGGGYGGGIAGPALAKGVTRHFKITIVDTTLTLDVDGIRIFNLTISGTTNPGYVGVSGMRNTGEIIMDNLRITPADVPASDTYAIGGTVKSGETPIAGANVVVKSGETVATRTITALDGTYTTVALAAGEYTVEASAPGYVASTKLVTVANAAVTDADLDLTLDTAGLLELYNAYKDQTQGYYTDASWQTLQDALTAAKAALDAPTPVSITGAYAGLTAAINALTEKPLDMSLLRTYYNSYNTYVSSDYTAESWAAFQTALKTAAAVLNNASAKQGEVNAACDALIAAEKALVRAGGGSGGSIGGGSNTTTETVKNEDGSTTITVTNKTTGTVTETTTGTDGTKVVTETKKDGTSTAVVTLPKNPEGPVTLPGKPASAGDTITIKTDKAAGVVIPVENVKPGIVPVIVKADGTEVIVKKSVTDENGVNLALDGSAVIKLVDNSKSFADVAEGHWAAGAIQFAASRELFQGTGGDSFSPAGDMTRAMLVTVLARLDGQDTEGGDTWYSKAMDWGIENGITDGTNVDASITRESLVVMLYRYAKAEKVDGMALSEFPDAADVSAWAAEAMSWAVAKGILKGADGKLNPGATASRAEVATMLQRFVSL